MPVPQLLAQAALLARLAAPGPLSLRRRGNPPLRGQAGLLRGGHRIGLGDPDGEGAGGGRVRVHRIGRRRTSRLAGAYDLNFGRGAAAFQSLRFHRRLMQGGKTEEHGYKIIPDSGRYREEGVPGDWVAPPSRWTSWPSSTISGPLRSRWAGATACSATSRPGTIPFRCGSPGASRWPWPMAATPNCLVVEVTSRGQTMRAWFTDDQRRLPVQLELPLPFGSVTLSLSGAAGRRGSGAVETTASPCPSCPHPDQYLPR